MSTSSRIRSHSLPPSLHTSALSRRYVSFWSPLLDATINPDTHFRYRTSVLRFLQFISSLGELNPSAMDFDYWLSFYASLGFANSDLSKSEFAKALSGLEHFLPEIKPLLLARRTLKGWNRLCPPRPYAPIPRDLCFALAVVCSLSDRLPSAIAMLVSFDCWLRISEVVSVTPRSIVDTRIVASHDPLSQCVSIFLPHTKTGPRQAVRIECAELASLVVAFSEASRLAYGPDTPIFPSASSLRSSLNFALGVLCPENQLETRGLDFTWHSFRHGGASRAFVSGTDMRDIRIRGRWSHDKSAEHYLQAGRQMLLSMTLSQEIHVLGRALKRLGLHSLAFVDFQNLLRSALREG